MDVFVAMTIPGDVQFGENPVDVDVEADKLPRRGLCSISMSRARAL